jgi:hypothetical protein
MLHPDLALAADQLVTQHGAVPDDDKLDTRAIQAAIDSAANEGGGTVRFPSGTFLSGGLLLKSNVTLKLHEGAVLRGSTDHRDYGEGRWSKALIKGDGLKNTGIRGPGTIDGADCKNPDGEEGFVWESSPVSFADPGSIKVEIRERDHRFALYREHVGPTFRIGGKAIRPGRTVKARASSVRSTTSPGKCSMSSAS